MRFGRKLKSGKGARVGFTISLRKKDLETGGKANEKKLFLMVFRGKGFNPETPNIGARCVYTNECLWASGAERFYEPKEAVAGTGRSPQGAGTAPTDIFTRVHITEK